MPNKIVDELIRRVGKIEDKLQEHLEQSGGIQTRLTFNTWLTGLILAALLTKFISEYFK